MGLTGYGMRIRILKDVPAEKPVEVPPQMATEKPKESVPAKA